MPLNIGDLNLSLGADTKGLQKATTKLTQFGKVIDKTARRQDAASQKAVSAMTRQETALRKALVGVVEMNRKVRALGLTREKENALLLKNTQAYKSLQTQLGKTATTQRNFSRASDDFANKMRSTKKAVDGLASNKAAGKVKGLSNVMRDLESASVLAVGPLSGIGARIRSLGAIANRSAIHVALFFGAMALGVVVIGKLLKSMVKYGLEMDQIQSKLAAATGSQERANAEFKFLREISDELGLNLRSVSKQYAALAAAARGTTLEGKKTRKIFLGIARASSAMKLSMEQTEGAIRAIQQIASKGQVQMEELRGQLAERIPSAVNLSAKAMGVLTAKLNKMVANGEVLAEDFLPKLADALSKAFGKQAVKNANSLTAAMNRLDNSFFMFNAQLENNIQLNNALAGFINRLAKAIDSLTNNLHNLVPLLQAIAIGMVAAFAPQIAAAIGAITTVILSLNKGLVVTRAVIATLGLGKFKALAKLMVKITVGAAAMKAAWELLKQEAPKVADALSNAAAKLAKFAGFSDDATTAMEDLRNALFEAQIQADIAGGTLTRRAGDFLLLAQNAGILAEVATKVNGTWKILDGTGKALATVFKQLSNEQDKLANLEKFKTLLTGIQSPLAAYKQSLQELIEIEDTLRNTYEGTELKKRLDQLGKIGDALAANAVGAKDYATQVGNAFREIAFGTGQVKEAVVDLIEAIAEMLFQKLILDAFVGALATSIGGFVGGFKGPSGTGTSPSNSALQGTGGGTSFGDKGLAFNGGNIVPFKKGGIIDKPTFFSHKGGTGVGGEAGTEAILPLQTMGNGDLGVSAASMGVSINIIDQRGSQAPPVEIEQSQGPDGKRQLSILIQSEVSKGFDTGAFDSSMKRNFGARRSAR